MTKPQISTLLLCLILLFFFLKGAAQGGENPTVKSQEVSEKNEIPILVKHLPDWENKQKSAVLVDNSDDLRKAFGSRPILDEIEFIHEMEAVTAPYTEGKLLIVEYNTPQASVALDKKIKEKLINSEERIFYRRIGNYNVFLFDGNDEIAANVLFDKIKYEKVVQWLGNDQTLFRQKERAFITGTSSLFISTVLAIASILGVAILIGLIVGTIYFYTRDRRLAAMDQFSDAGGMTRLNLDGFTPDIVPSRLLDK